MCGAIRFDFPPHVFQSDSDQRLSFPRRQSRAPGGTTGSRLRRRYAAEPDARQAYNAVDIVNRLDIEPLAIYWRSYGVHMRYTCERGSFACPGFAVARPGREGARRGRSRSGTV